MQSSRRLLVAAVTLLGVALAACTDGAPTAAPAASAELPSLSMSAAEKARLETQRDARKARLETAKRASKQQYDSLKRAWDRHKNQVEKGAVEILECEPQEFAYDVEIIGPAGGHLDVGPHHFVVPKGALDSNVVIEAVAPLSPVREMRFEPHGLRFAKSASLELSYKDCFLPADFRGEVVYTNDAYDVLEIERTQNTGWLNQTLRAAIDHFSGYVIAHARTAAF